MKSYTQLKKTLLTDPAIKQAYDTLEPEYALIQTIIDKRLQKNMSQRDLAQKIGTKQSAISRLESGNANPSMEFLQKVATALGTRLHISLQ